MNKITLLVLSFIILSCHAQPNQMMSLQEEVEKLLETVADGILFLGEWLGSDGSMLVTEKSGILPP
jgi:hypothetical protein